MKVYRFLLLVLAMPVLMQFSPGNIPCGEQNLFRIGHDDLPGISCCFSDSLILKTREITRDTFRQEKSTCFLYCDVYTNQSDSEQKYLVMLYNQKTGRVVKYKMTCDNSANSFSVLIPFWKIHGPFEKTADFKVSFLKIGEDAKTLECDAGQVHIIF